MRKKPEEPWMTMVPGNTRELANWLIPAWKSKGVSAHNLLFTALVSSETGRLKVQFLKRNNSTFFGLYNNREWSWATKLRYVWNSNVQKIKFKCIGWEFIGGTTTVCQSFRLGLYFENLPLHSPATQPSVVCTLQTICTKYLYLQVRHFKRKKTKSLLLTISIISMSPCSSGKQERIPL